MGPIQVGLQHYLAVCEGSMARSHRITLRLLGQGAVVIGGVLPPRALWLGIDGLVWLTTASCATQKTRAKATPSVAFEIPSNSVKST